MKHQIKTWALYSYQLPLHKPILARDAHSKIRKGLIVIQKQQDRWGIGEAAPIPGFHSQSLTDVYQELRSWLRDRDPQKRSTLGSLSQFALDMSEYPYDKPNIDIAINGLLGAPADISADDFDCYKIKVGRQPIEDDLAMLHQFASLLPEKVQIRLDANRAWSLEQSLRFWEGLKKIPLNIDYIEEPLQDMTSADQLPFRFALDESLPLFSDDIDRLTSRFPNIAALILKPSLQGGLFRAESMVKQATSIGLRTVISSTFESSIGLFALANLAAHQPKTHAGLGTQSWFAQDLIAPQAKPCRGFLQTRGDIALDEIRWALLHKEAQG